MLTPRQRELFDALYTHFLTHGFADFTIDGAAAAHHCSKSTVYALGRTRDDIIRRILVTFFKEVTRQVDAQLAGLRTQQAILETYFSAMTSALEPASPAFMRDLATEPVAREVYELNTAAATEKIAGIIDKGVEKGEFSTTAPEFLTLVIRGTMEQIQQGTYAATLPFADAYRELGKIILHGIVTRV
ncbi:TetR/AcrR family transcriptional regulator [Corynebacterium hindlerae]|uniref:TetR/AcrR family transcriptional regulator n=1 Tax=Corynebacterium hindlerae TaxID=699041 RepID=UPI0031B6F8CE